MDEIKTLRGWMERSGSNVFLGGAGVSTASGIPDFRSAHGLYMQEKQGISYEEMLSHNYYMQHTPDFYDFMRRVMLYPDAKPNGAHYALAELEREGLLDVVITQNIDGLHQAAGSKNVIELHGNEDRYICQRCGKIYNMRYVMESEGIPLCECGGQLKPDVVLYGEQLNERDLERAVEYAAGAGLLLVGGTSLVVYPVAGLVNYIGRGAKLVIINRDETPYDRGADMLIRDDLAEVLSRLASTK